LNEYTQALPLSISSRPFAIMDEWTIGIRKGGQTHLKKELETFRNAADFSCKGAIF
jgi:hypothetical protein